MVIPGIEITETKEGCTLLWVISTTVRDGERGSIGRVRTRGRLEAGLSRVKIVENVGEQQLNG